MTRDAEEFRRIHAEFRPRVFRHLARLVGEGEAEDLTQTVMLKVSDGLGDFRGDSTVATWIYRIATNAALDRLRLAGRRQEPPQDALRAETEPDSGEGSTRIEAPSPSVERTAIRQEMNACIRELIERLPENYLTVMVLGELEGFKNAEIAEILAVSLDTVKIRLHRARKLLRAELDAECNFYRSEDNDLACDRRSPVSFVG